MIDLAQKLSQRFSHGACQFSTAPVRVQPVISTFNLLHLRQSRISRTVHLTLCQVHVERNYYYAPCAIHLRERERKKNSQLFGLLSFPITVKTQRSNRALSQLYFSLPRTAYCTNCTGQTRSHSDPPRTLAEKTQQGASQPNNNEVVIYQNKFCLKKDQAHSLNHFQFWMCAIACGLIKCLIELVYFLPKVAYILVEKWAERCL